MKNFKKNYTLLFLLFISLFVQGQIRLPSYKKLTGDFKGNVKSIEVIEYSAIDFFGELKKESVYKTAFANLNEKNLPINIEVVDEKGVGIAEFTFKNQDKIIDCRFVLNNTNVESYKYNYDDKGNIIEKNEYKGDTLYEKEIAIYDKNNKEIEYRRYNEDGILAEKITKKYDLKGKKILYEGLHDWGYTSKYLYKYNNGMLIEKLYFNNGILNTKTYYKYYNSGKIKEEVEEEINKSNIFKYISQYNSDGKLVIRNQVFENGEKNELLKKINYSNKNIVYEEDSYSKNFYTYDSKGNLLRKEVNYTDKEKYITKNITLFEYDDKGNWIKSIKSDIFKDNPIENPKKIITERTFVYK